MSFRYIVNIAPKGFFEPAAGFSCFNEAIHYFGREYPGGYDVQLVDTEQVAVLEDGTKGFKIYTAADIENLTDDFVEAKINEDLGGEMLEA